MKKLALISVVLISFVLTPSCEVEEIEYPKQKQSENIVYPDFMTQRDSVSKDEDEIDPPTKPTVIVVKP